jgi:hypothetical protein
MKKVFSSFRKSSKNASSTNEKQQGDDRRADNHTQGDGGVPHSSGQASKPPMRPPRTTSLRENLEREADTAGPPSHSSSSSDMHATKPAARPPLEHAKANASSSTSLRKSVVAPAQNQAAHATNTNDIQHHASKPNKRMEDADVAPMAHGQHPASAHTNGHQDQSTSRRGSSSVRKKSDLDAHMPREAESSKSSASRSAPECVICKEAGRVNWKALTCGHAFHTNW